jgi:arginine decarboxylase
MNDINKSASLYKELIDYSKKDICPMHMPGHKRNPEYFIDGLPYFMDITEIDGFDNLNDPEGIIKECEDRGSKLYGSKKTFFLVNGSTSGILAGIRSLVNYGDKVIISRNSHKAVYHAIELNGLKTCYLNPVVDEEYQISGSISLDMVKEAIYKNEDTKLIIITSPTYEGVVSDIAGIVKLAHEKGIPVLVDEAHGAHLGFTKGFPSNSIKAGADIVIHSLHKTLPTLTQCALAHVGGNIVDINRLSKELSIFQTSSPSYILMASIDNCIRLLMEKEKELFYPYEKNLDSFSDKLCSLKNLSVLCKGNDRIENHPGIYKFDKGKIIINTKRTNYTGSMLAEVLRDKYHIEIEMTSVNYVVAMTSICDKEENFIRLLEALLEIDKDCTLINGEAPSNKMWQELPKVKYKISEISNEKGSFVLLEEAINHVSLEYVWAYPPGIPLIVPGEIITKNTIDNFKDRIVSGTRLRSTKGRLPKEINVKID